MNNATLIGNLADDPKLIRTSSGIAKCTFRLATQRRFVNQQSGQREADFHNIVVWRQLAELCGKYLAKGKKCAVRGSIQYRDYDAQDGSKRYITEILAEEVQFLSPASQQSNQAENDGFVPIDDDELPF